MSGSTKKKLRKEQAAAAMTEKQRQAQKEAKTLKAYTLTFVIVMVLVVSMVLGIALRSPVESLINQNTHAVTIGTHELTIPEFSYYFVDEINSYYLNLYNYYGSYASYFMGFNTNKSLNKQVYDQSTGETWAQHFMKEAAESAQTIYGLYDLAVKAGHTMTEDETKTMNGQIEGLTTTAEAYGYSTVNAYLRGVYGNGATKETYEEYIAVSALANSFYAQYRESVKDSYTEETFKKYEEDKVGQYYSYSYFLYQINVKDYLGEGTKDENGKVTYTEDEKAAALAAARADVQVLLDSGIIDEATFNAALLKIQKETEKTEESTTKSTTSTESTDATTGSGSTEDKKEETKDVPLCTVGTDVLYSSLSATLKDWVVSDKLVTGTTTSVEIKTEKEHTHPEGEEHSDDEEVEYEVTGFYVILMTNVNKNDMKLVNVRHILITVDGITSSSTQEQKDEADKAAKDQAEAILKQWKENGGTVEYFAELANKNSKDTGSNTNGGLYEDVYPGWAVKEFNAWCFDAERQAGDSGVVKTDNGYHVMYLDGYGEYTYRNYLIMNDKLNEDMEAYLEGVIEATPYVEVDLSRMNWDITFG